MDTNFGKIIKTLRLSKKMTQSDLAELLGTTKSNVSAYENDSRQPPNSSLVKMAKHFGVSMDYLFNLDGDGEKDYVDISYLPKRQKDVIHELVAIFKEVPKEFRNRSPYTKEETNLIVNDIVSQEEIDRLKKAKKS